MYCIQWKVDVKLSDYLNGGELKKKAQIVTIERSHMKVMRGATGKK